MVTETETVADEELAEAPEIEEGEAEQPAEESVDDLLSRPEVAARIKEQVDQAARQSADRERARVVSEQRRRFASAETAASALIDIAREVSERGETDQSTKTKAQNLFAMHGHAVSDQLAEAFIDQFFNDGPLKVDAEARLQAKDLSSNGEYDQALMVLLTASAADKASALEADFNNRVVSEVEKRVKAELKAREEGGTAPPPTPRGGGARLGASLTTAELSISDRRVQEAIRALPKAQREKVYDRVAVADQRRGADAIRDIGTILADLESLAG